MKILFIAQCYAPEDVSGAAMFTELQSADILRWDFNLQSLKP